MFNIFNLFAKKSPVKETVCAITKSDHELMVADAREAVQLPVDYFKKWSTSNFDVTISASIAEVEANRTSLVQSPLHHIMSGGHSFVTETAREKLWADGRYVNAIKWVLSQQDPRVVATWVGAMTNHGYWRPMAETLKIALEKGYVGCKCSKTYSPEKGVEVIFS